MVVIESVDDDCTTTLARVNWSPAVVSVTSVITVTLAVCVLPNHSMRNHAVPSLAIAQSTLPLGDGIVANRFVTTAVFGVLVWYLNVTVFVALIDHAPVNVATRKTRFADSATRSNVSGCAAGRCDSTTCTAFAMRAADARVNVMRPASDSALRNAMMPCYRLRPAIGQTARPA
jgi:hypothetical protein